MKKTKTEESCFYYIQEGGSSTEGFYLHGFDKLKDAVAHRGGAIRSAYNVGPIIPVSKALANRPGFDEFVSELIKKGIPS